MRWRVVALLSAAACFAQLEWTAAEDHRNMMEQLGIRSLRPGPSGRENAPNPANYDESKANPFPTLPDALTLKNGRKVKKAEVWWKQRRPEIVEEFEREVVGRVPKVVPKVAWSVTERVETKVGEHAVVAKTLTGRVDNSAYPAISVDIQLSLVTPAQATGRVPVMIMFGRAGLPSSAPPGRFYSPGPELLIAAGWGYATLTPASIQADNGAGLRKGIIGLVNKGGAAEAGGLGRAAGLGVGGEPGARLSGDGCG